MDKLEFIIQDKQNDDCQFKSVTILINGQNLINLLKVYELPFAKKERAENIAGGYEEITPEILLDNLTNPDEFDTVQNGKISIFECECGCEGCWPMKIKIIELGDRVIWTDFEQPHRSINSHNFWDYRNFGPFSFDKDCYFKQLDILRKNK